MGQWLDALGNDLAIEEDGDGVAVSQEVIDRCQARAREMLRKCRKVNPKQYNLIVDPAPHVAGLCPRRAGKSYGGCLAALITGEWKPGAISIIISLNKAQLRRIYWSGGPSGLYRLSKEFGLNIKFNSTHLMWKHENGSIGYLLGCEDDGQLEVIRGLEADLYLIDECKSFAPGKLVKLIDDIIDPQRSSRMGRLMLIGTPGFIPAGPFYEATCPTARDHKTGLPFSVKFGESDPHEITLEDGSKRFRTAKDDLLWSLHTWTLEENTALRWQWTEALKKKRAKGWADDHPAWLREYLGQWTFTGDGLVFAYAQMKALGRCMWKPVISKDNPTGLPPDGTWRFVGGLDLGYEAPTAFVIAAYSRKYGQIRHVADFSTKHLLPHEVADRVIMMQKALNISCEVIYVDGGNYGKAVAEEFQQSYGIPVELAKKREKLDYIELVNSSFTQGEILIIPGTTLETQLLTNCWDIDEVDEATLPTFSDGTQMSAKENMARLGQLVEDDSVPNDSTDAFLYLYRGCMHRFGKTAEEAALEEGTPEWFAAKEAKALAAFRKQLREEEASPRGVLTKNQLPPAPYGVQQALLPTRRQNTWTNLTLTIWQPSSMSSTGQNARLQASLTGR